MTKHEFVVLASNRRTRSAPALLLALIAMVWDISSSSQLRHRSLSNAIIHGSTTIDPRSVVLKDREINPQSDQFYEGPCEHSEDFFPFDNRTLDRQARICLVPINGGRRCHLEYVDNVLEGWLRSKGLVMEMEKRVMGRTSNVLLGIQQLLVEGAACARMVFINRNQTDSLTGYFSCVDFRNFITAKSQCENLPPKRMNSQLVRSSVSNARYPLEIREMARRLFLSFMGVKKGSYRGRTCPLTEQDAVAHIRGGDVFNDQHVHPRYGQPAMEYYAQAVRRFPEQVARLVLLSEDNSNPVFVAISPSTPGFGKLKVIKKLPTFEDVMILSMCAKVFIGAQSTWSYIVKGSPNLETLFVPYSEPYVGLKSPQARVFKWEVDEKYLVHAEWRNTEAQRQQMISFQGGRMKDISLLV